MESNVLNELDESPSKRRRMEDAANDQNKAFSNGEMRMSFLAQDELREMCASEREQVAEQKGEDERYTKVELMRLMHKAVEFTEKPDKQNESDRPFQQFRWFYRCKSQEYWQNIEHNHGCVMKSYRKDNCGHKKSPINGRLDGLFFSCHREWGDVDRLREDSWFGARRLRVPADHLFHPEHHRLWFADFYCLRGLKFHYVTLVITTIATEQDKFCEQQLIPMDMTNNPFLKRWVVYDKCRFYTMYKVDKPEGGGALLEIFFAGDVLINPKSLEDVKETIRRNTTNTGIPANEDCVICSVPELPVDEQATSREQTVGAATMSASENGGHDDMDSLSDLNTDGILN